MAERANYECIDLDKCKQFARNLFGMQQTPFFVPQYKYAETAATLARNIFESRRDMEYLIAEDTATRFHDADVIEAAGILTNTALYGWANYDTLAEVASTEVADYLQYVNINKNESFFKSTSNLLSQLCVCNSLKMYGPIFIVLARALTLADMVGAQPNASMLGRYSASYAAQLWSAYHIIFELKRALVYTWSDYTEKLFRDVMPILRSWKEQNAITLVNYKGIVHWKLDTTVNTNKESYAYKEIQ